MLIDVAAPLRVKLKAGDLGLVPGTTVDLPTDIAYQLLRQLPHQVRCLRPEIELEPAAAGARPVYWETADGHILGPAVPEYLARVTENGRDTFWVIVLYDGLPRWVQSDYLRSRRAFETQPTFRIEEPIRDL